MVSVVAFGEIVKVSPTGIKADVRPIEVPEAADNKALTLVRSLIQLIICQLPGKPTPTFIDYFHRILCGAVGLH